MLKLRALTLTIVIGTTTLVGCGNDEPSVADWTAKAVKICTQLISDRTAAAAALPSDQAPTPEQVMAFYADFAPKFTAAAKATKALERPKGLDAKIDELEAALDAAAAYGQRSATDRSAVEAEMALGDVQPAEYQRLEAATTAVGGLDQCNE